MDADTTKQKTTDTKPKKSKGPIRWEAITPFLIFMVLIGVYFTLFFDSNMKNLIEFVGYKALGAEVNVAHFETSFKNASL